MKRYTFYKDEDYTPGKRGSSHVSGWWISFRAENMDAAKRFMQNPRCNFDAKWHGQKPPQFPFPEMPLHQGVKFHDVRPGVVLVMDGIKVYWLDEERVH
jgi:hypothetical protein